MLSVYVDQGNLPRRLFFYGVLKVETKVFLPPPGWSKTCDPGSELPCRDVGSRDEGTRGEGERIFSISYV